MSTLNQYLLDESLCGIAWSFEGDIRDNSLYAEMNLISHGQLAPMVEKEIEYPLLILFEAHGHPFFLLCLGSQKFSKDLLPSRTFDSGSSFLKISKKSPPSFQTL